MIEQTALITNDAVVLGILMGILGLVFWTSESNIVFFKKWLDIGSGFLNTSHVLNEINWNLSELQNGYMDTNDYNDRIAIHFFSFFSPWNSNNLRFYPIWENYNKKTLNENNII